MTKIEQKVMASVGAVYATRRLVSAAALKLYALVASVYALGVLVWVSKIEENLLSVMNGGVLAVGNFALHAVTHTNSATQVVFAVAVFAMSSLALDITRSMTHQQAYA